MLKSKPSWPHDLILGLLPLIIGFQIFISLEYLPLGLHGFADFRQLYTGGYMLRTGHSSELYDYAAQQRFEDALLPLRVPFVLPINHPAFEELVFVPLSLVSYRTAFWTFLVLNIALLALCLRLLKPQLKVLSNRWKWFPTFLFVAFFPIVRTLTQGQDSIIMLTILAGALVALHHEKDMTAGLLLGLGVFKFQIVIPIAFLFLVWRRWWFAVGCTISSVLAALVSIWIVGLNGARVYVQTLLSMSVHLNSKLDMLRYNTIPNEMLNLRGLISAFLDGKLPPMWIQALILLSSAAVMLIAGRQRPSLPLAITASSLVSYHLIAHDASVLIIPVSLALCAEDVWKRAVAGLLLVAPISGIFPRYGYLAAIPILVFFFSTLSSSQGYGETPMHR